jgi:site-specific DNA-methyltransferase (adenine-specific)
MSNNQANHTATRREDWGTPPDLFAKLSTAHDFVIDLCASAENALCDNYIDERIDLMSPMGAELVEMVAEGCGSTLGPSYAWINPPYQGGGKTGLFVARAAELCLENCLGLVALIPASVGSRWWRECVDPFFDFVIFPPRLTYAGAPATAQFDSAICVMHPLDKVGPDPVHFELGAVYRRLWAAK